MAAYVHVHTHKVLDSGLTLSNKTRETGKQVELSDIQKVNFSIEPHCYSLVQDCCHFNHQ